MRFNLSTHHHLHAEHCGTTGAFHLDLLSHKVHTKEVRDYASQQNHKSTTTTKNVCTKTTRTEYEAKKLFRKITDLTL